jgi:hypothetical protein
MLPYRFRPYCPFNTRLAPTSMYMEVAQYVQAMSQMLAFKLPA